MNDKNLLTKGLQEGFAGSTVRKGVKRGDFKLESSHYETEDGDIYHDEWMASRAGGGQELIEVDGKRFTRVYAGGTISKKALESLGLAEKDVIGFLIKQISDNGDKIRLYKDFLPESEGDWRYEYKIINSEEEIPVTTGKESVFYKEMMVFTHIFVLSPVE